MMEYSYLGKYVGIWLSHWRTNKNETVEERKQTMFSRIMFYINTYRLETDRETLINNVKKAFNTEKKSTRLAFCKDLAENCYWRRDESEGLPEPSGCRSRVVSTTQQVITTTQQVVTTQQTDPLDAFQEFSFQGDASAQEETNDTSNFDFFDELLNQPTPPIRPTTARIPIGVEVQTSTGRVVITRNSSTGQTVVNQVRHVVIPYNGRSESQPRVHHNQLLPEHFVKEFWDMIKSKNETIECPVCYDTIEEGQLAITVCGHKYCKGCVSRLEHKCAVCRTQL